ncbi:FkbM family methyltransferase [Phenylobacterium sp.]|jgi:FkbM family methyltransferase|uniref:FkbM family methyltransferase n=1 Tax=Phenylobacterium sp. TaxID=1871053 RepID=UPI002E320D1F|nr:FkbM family methyltransferase [Phenylobacterium sp.]HEX2558683.1 FkbM family methyltransferase [Phenylobacterium sp.]
MDQEKLAAALEKLRATPGWREAFVRHLLALEKEIATPGVDLREEVTGPLVDAVYQEGEPVRRSLSNGVTFEFLYRSKIARDFVMSEPAVPDHAWEPMTSRIVVDLAKGAQQVVIGGAYFGDHAILIAREIAKNGGVVHAFEPNSDQRRMLMRNAEINGLTNIVARPEGLWSSSSEHLKLVGYDSFATAEKADAGAADAFQTVTIADYLAAQGVDRLDLIVIDIEGAELAALKGAEKYLAGPAGPHIVYEVHRHYVDWSQGMDQTEISRFLTGLGYHLFALRDFNSNVDLSGKPVELIPQDKVYLEGPPHGFNMVAVKDPTVFDGPGYRIVENVSPKLLRHKDPKLHHPVDGL